MAKKIVVRPCDDEDEHGRPRRVWDVWVYEGRGDTAQGYAVGWYYTRAEARAEALRLREEGVR